MSTLPAGAGGASENPAAAALPESASTNNAVQTLFIGSSPSRRFRQSRIARRPRAGRSMPLLLLFLVVRAAEILARVVLEFFLHAVVHLLGGRRQVRVTCEYAHRDATDDVVGFA